VVAPAAGGEQEQKPIVDAQQQQPQGGAKADVSGAPVDAGKRLLHSEERVEYRDQDGNLLNEEQVKALEGKVEFKTRYETRTRVVDAQGNEVLLPPGEQPPPPAQEQEKVAAAGVAPPHPDVEGMFLPSDPPCALVWSGVLTRPRSRCQ
jgi:dolichyl-phosphate-mannose-protein mannosyltransferase